MPSKLDTELREVYDVTQWAKQWAKQWGFAAAREGYEHYLLRTHPDRIETQNVYALLEHETDKEKRKQLALYIVEHRPELRDEVHDALVELNQL